MAPLDYPETNLFREINGYSIEAIRISKRKRIVHSINITIPPLRVDDVKRRSYNPVRARKPPLRPRHIPGPKPIHPRLRIALLPRKLQCCRRLTRRRGDQSGQRGTSHNEAAFLGGFEQNRVAVFCHRDAPLFDHTSSAPPASGSFTRSRQTSSRWHSANSIDASANRGLRGSRTSDLNSVTQ